VDPGVYTAFAALNLKGQLVASGCEKEASDERVVEIIRHVGVPSLIASDVNPPPSFVQKVAARFNVRLSYPVRSLTQEEKKTMGGFIDDVHIRDAYGAAMKAYHIYENRLRQIEGMDTALDKDLLKHMVVQGYSLHNAELMLTRKEEKRVDAGEPKTEIGHQKRDERVARLAEENVNLRKAYELEKARADGLEAELRRAKNVRVGEVTRDSEVKKLQGRLERAERYIFFLKKKKKG
jgi:predicted RNase H-like nuclease (RuvC/YqgF family)